MNLEMQMVAPAMLDVVSVTDRQAHLIFESLAFARKKIESEPGDEALEAELTEAMRLFAWRD
jgi:hypothetical protein